MGQSIKYSPKVDWLNGKGHNQYTQFGEDGLIAATFERIGETNRQAVEIGAADGLFFSNTLRLREQGWKAVLLESDDRLFAKLQQDYGDSAVCIHGKITDLDTALDATGIDHKPDLGIIDIDGQDYWMWRDMVKYRPRVMLVEIYPPDTAAKIPARGATRGQTGLDEIHRLGTEKGYLLVATTHCNALFVDGDEF